MGSRKADVIAFPEQGAAPAANQKKTVPALQAAVDALPPNSGDWRVEGVPGLYVRVGVQGRSYRIQRRIDGRLVVEVLGDLTVAQARRKAMETWAALKPPPVHGRMTLGEAWQRHLGEKPLAESTRRLYQYNGERYLKAWLGRSLEEVGRDRAGVRALYQKLARQHGLASAAQVIRMLSAVYRYFRRVEPDLPECPTIAVDVQAVRARDWGLSPEELRQWWAAVEQLRSPVKRAWWVTALLTGARASSLVHLRWRDVDLDRGTIHFAVAKAGRTYTVPASQRLLEHLREWQAQAPPGEWVFESPRRPGAPLFAQVRDDKRGVMSAHHLRHTYRTTLAELGATPDQARLLLGHSLGGDVSRGYITAHLLVESLRPLANAVADRYAEILGW